MSKVRKKRIESELNPGAVDAATASGPSAEQSMPSDPSAASADIPEAAGGDREPTGPIGVVPPSPEDMDGTPLPDVDTDEQAVRAADQEVTTEQVIEAILFGADAPLPPAKIVAIAGTGSARDIRDAVEELNSRYAASGASFRIEKIAGGYQMLTLPAFNPWLKRLRQNRQESKLSQPALETLAVVAYKQPVMRAEIEAIRGVATGEMLNRLRELGLVKIVGRAEDVGRPLLYGTTKRFLDVFGLGSLDDLPAVEELKSPD